jgi:hypothetical protein
MHETHPCYLSFFFDDEHGLESTSFDVEAADDYHYQFSADQLPKLCEILKCSLNPVDIIAAFNEQLASWNNPIRIAALLQEAGVKYQVFHSY